MQVIGQKPIKELLVRQIKENQVPHAQLFCGPEGCGKLPMALYFAQSLLCTQRQENGEACGECQSCRMARKLEHPDLHFVFPVIRPKAKKSGEVVSDNYIKEWRDLVLEGGYFDPITWLSRMGVENQQSQISVAESDLILRKLSLISGQGGYKVMIIWQPEQMNGSAANKLLKILEEPPAKTVFLLVSDHPEKLLTTITSRTQRIEFKALTQHEIAEALVNINHLQPQDAKNIARTCSGSYVKALNSLRVNEDRALFFDMFVLLMRLSYMRKIKDMHAWSEQVAGWGRERQKNFLQYCQYLLRENFIYNFRQPEMNAMNATEAEFSTKFARFVNERNVIGIMDELSKAESDIEQNVNARIVFFDFSLKMIVLLIQ